MKYGARFYLGAINAGTLVAKMASARRPGLVSSSEARQLDPGSATVRMCDTGVVTNKHYKLKVEYNFFGLFYRIVLVIRGLYSV